MKLVDLFGHSTQKISFISKVLQSMGLLAPSKRQTKIIQAMTLPLFLISPWHNSFFTYFSCNETHNYSSSLTLQRREEKRKRPNYCLRCTQSIQLTQLLCGKVYLLKLITVSHSPCHKITLCTPSKHKIPVLLGLIFGQKNISELERKQGCPKLSKVQLCWCTRYNLKGIG